MRLKAHCKDRMMAESRLALVGAKIERAKKNLVDMEADLIAFYADMHVSDTDPDPTHVFVNQPEPIRVTFDALAAAGDVVNNLWGALDHLVYQLIEAYSPDAGDDVLDMSAFPFGKTRSSYEKAKCRRKIQFIDPLAIDLIDSLKPYTDAGGPLALLNELNNVSKHQLILTVGKEVFCHAEWIGEMSFSEWFKYIVSDPHFIGVFDPKMNQDAQVAGGESLNKSQIAWGNAMLPTLHQLADFVDRLVPQFLPFLKPHTPANPL